MKNREKKITPLKVLRGILIVIAAIVVVFVCAVRVYFQAPVFSYYANSKKAFVIPDCNKNYIAQGITYDEKSGNFYLTGYMNDGSASPIYIVNKASKKLVKTIRMANPDGSDFLGHNGGLTIFGDKIYVAGGENACLYVLDKAKVDSAENKSSIKYSDIVSLKTPGDAIGVAFTTVKDNILYAGEFYRDPPYPTLDSHIVKTENGENHAITVGVKLDGNVAEPVVAYSTIGNVQGMCFGEDGILITTSWGVGFSYVYKYTYESLVQKGTKEVLGKEVPLYVLDETNFAASYKLPPMAEEIECVDGLYYISNESASNKYIFGKLTSGKWCYASKF